jgi:hypothetical protein
VSAALVGALVLLITQFAALADVFPRMDLFAAAQESIVDPVRPVASVIPKRSAAATLRAPH